MKQANSKFKIHPEKFREFPAPRDSRISGIKSPKSYRFQGRLSPRNLSKIPEGDSRLQITDFPIFNFQSSIFNTKFSIFNLQSSIANSNGMVLIIVLVIVAILSAIGVTFTASMRLEEKTAFNYMGNVKASDMAKAGLQHAIAQLKKDNPDTGYDSYEESWGYLCNDADDSIFSAFTDIDDDTHCVDNDTSAATVGSGCSSGRDSRWINVQDNSGNIIGRYAVLILDEAGKININTAGNSQNQGWSVFEINLEDFLTVGENDLGWNLGSSNPTQLAERIVRRRYGSDNGTDSTKEAGANSADDDSDSIILLYDGIDNDADGDTDEFGEGVDEPDEFVNWNPYQNGSDTPYVTIEEIKHVNNIGNTIYQKMKPYITVYSSDFNTSDSGFLRLNINQVKEASVLYSVLENAWEDAGDDPEPGDNLEQITVNIIDYADEDTIPTYGEIGTKKVRGVESLRINEIMVKPVYQFEAEDIFPDHEGYWKTLSTGDTCLQMDINDVSDTAVTDTDDPAIMPLERAGYYNLRLLTFDNADEIRSFLVYVDGVLQDTCAWHNTGGWFLDDLGVVKDAEGQPRLLSAEDVQITFDPDTDINAPAMVDYIQLSQQPDCEYVELVNISDTNLDISGWTLTTSAGFQGTIPDNSVVEAKDYLVLVVDQNDAGNGVGGNDICFDNTWTGVDNVVELQLSTSPNPIAALERGDSEIYFGGVFHDLPLWGDNPDTPMHITLWNGPLDKAEIIAQVDYTAAQVDTVAYTVADLDVRGFVALEKNDPTVIEDQDGDGADDHWLGNTQDRKVATIKGGTPGAKNNVCTKTPGEDVAARDLPYATPVHIKEVSSSKTSSDEWSNLGYDSSGGEDKTLIVRIADRLTVSQKRLEAEHDTAFSHSWTYADPDDTFLTPYYHTGEVIADTWWWGKDHRISSDTAFYSLYIKGKAVDDTGLSAEVKVTVSTAFGDTGPITLSFSPDGTAYFGEVEIGATANSDSYLGVHLENPCDTYIACFDAVVLAPEYKTYGRINVNTADTPVLQALPGITSTEADDIVNNRPFGNMGELLSDCTEISLEEFSRICNLITTKSNTFTIISIGQALRESAEGDVEINGKRYEVLGEKKYRAVVER